MLSHVMENVSIDVVYSPSGHSVSLYARCKEQQVGKAFLAINGERARLIDINVYRRKGHWSKTPPFYMRSVNYQNKGIGTDLLERVIEVCSAENVRSLEGVMYGDIDRLRPWYEQHGFRIAPGFNIHRDIHVS